MPDDIQSMAKACADRGANEIASIVSEPNTIIRTYNASWRLPRNCDCYTSISDILIVRRFLLSIMAVPARLTISILLTLY